jgi:hypothetical protein
MNIGRKKRMNNAECSIHNEQIKKQKCEKGYGRKEVQRKIGMSMH